MRGPLAQLTDPTAAPIALPILTYPGGPIIGANVRTLVTDPEAQRRAQLALAERYPLRALLTCMDLSVEAEAFGSEIHLAEDEIPTVTNRLATTAAEVDRLAIPTIGSGRTGVYLEAAHRLRQVAGDRLVLGGMVGPFSLAARLHGVAEALSLTLSDPDLMHALVAKATAFLKTYAAAFREAGADGVIMAEPTAGLLSPRWLAAFSSRYIAEIVDAVQNHAFSVILHNCAAKPVHLAPSLEAGTHALHFGAPMNLTEAVAATPHDVLVLGNLDPAGVFVQSPPADVSNATRTLLQATGGAPNFVISSGCDLPPSTPIENVDAFFAAVREPGI